MAQGINCTEAYGIFLARDRAIVPHIGRQIPNHWTTREVLLQAFFPLNLFIFNLRTTTILLVSAIHQHGSAIAILMCPPLWKSFNPGILCSQSCPRNSGHNVPLSPQEDKSFFLLCHVLSLYKWQVLYLSKFRALIIILVPQLCLTLCDPMGSNPPDSSVHGDSPGKNAGVGCHFLLQEILPTKGSSQVSCIAGRFFIIWITRNAHQ